MSTETLQINLVQKIFNIWGKNFLQKINDFISSGDIVGYTAGGVPLTTEQYKK
jgi:hypothetical protein